MSAGEQLDPVNVARLQAADRADAVAPFVGEIVAVTAKWGPGREMASDFRGRAVSVATVYGEGDMSVLVLHTDTGRVLATKMSRLQTVALADVEDQDDEDDETLCAGCGAVIPEPDTAPGVKAIERGGRLCPRCAAE